MAEPFTLYKLIILYMLDRVDFPLTNSQISSFLLDRGYTNYFTLQQAFSELEEASLVISQTIRNTTQFQLTKSGREALGYFCDRIPHTIQNCEMKSRLPQTITAPQQKTMPFTVL